MKLVLADSEYGYAYTREIEISWFAWNVRERCFIFSVGISDGFYHSNFRPSVEVERIDFKGSHARLQLKSQQSVDTLAVELLKQNAEAAESRANVRM